MSAAIAEPEADLYYCLSHYPLDECIGFADEKYNLYKKNTSEAVATLTRHFYDQGLWMVYKNKKI